MNELSVQKTAEPSPARHPIRMGFGIVVTPVDGFGMHGEPVEDYIFFGDLNDEISRLYLRYGDEIEVTITR